MMKHHDAETQSSIDACFDCHRACTETAFDHCLRVGGKHTAREHFGLMLDCADVCLTTAKFLLSDNQFHERLCAVCAETCFACAESCRKLGGMDDCVRACLTCGDLCRAMAGAEATA
jgi:hypothetical protein